jgi:hypothetical protein
LEEGGGVGNVSSHSRSIRDDRQFGSETEQPILDRFDLGVDAEMLRLDRHDLFSHPGLGIRAV